MNTLATTLMRILTHPSTNEVDEYDGYYVSYSRDAYGCDSLDGETALVVDDNFYILNGDWRLEYAMAKNLEACLALFKANQHLRSTWSD